MKVGVEGLTKGKQYNTPLGNLTWDELKKFVPELVAKSSEQFKDYIRDTLVISSTRNRKIPVLAFLGHGRCGKDTAGAWLSANFQVVFNGSTSHFMCPMIAYALGQTHNETYDTRHDDRDFWFQFCNEFRRHDPTLLAKIALATSDIVAGLRSAIELDACMTQNVIDLSIWIDNPNVDPDPTVEFGQDDCDIIILNSGSKLLFYNKLRRLARTLGLQPRIGQYGV